MDEGRGQSPRKAVKVRHFKGGSRPPPGPSSVDDLYPLEAGRPDVALPPRDSLAKEFWRGGTSGPISPCLEPTERSFQRSPFA
jgi:hypothetical protein